MFDWDAMAEVARAIIDAAQSVDLSLHKHAGEQVPEGDSSKGKGKGGAAKGGKKGK